MKVENNLDTDQIKQLVWRLAIPSMLAQFVSVFYSIVDRMYIGNISKTGELALAGVGVCGPIVTLVSSFAFLVGIGGAPLMSICMGQKDKKEAKKILANCFFMLLVISFAITAISLAIRKPLLMWFGASEVIFPYAEEYISIYLCGTIFALMSVGMNQFIICQGYAKTAMKTVMLGAILNILLDPLFIFVLHMGVRGAAFATVLSQAGSCIYVLSFLFSNKVSIKISFGGYQWKIIGRVLMVGLTPFLIIAFDNILIIALNTVIQRYGGAGRGDMLLTCTTIVQSFMLLITMPMSGITGGTQTILGYNYGARRPDRIKKAFFYITLLCFSFSLIMFVIAQTIPQFFVRIFTEEQEYIDLTVWAIKKYTLGVLPLAIQYALVDGLTGMGMTKWSISFSMFRKLVFFACIFILPKCTDIVNIFFAEPISDVLGPVVTIIGFSIVMKKILAELKNQTDC